MTGWTGRRVLVTGAGGFIGSHLAERLVGAGATVRALLRYTSTASRGWLDGSPAGESIEVFAGDLCDRDVLSRAVRGVDVVFHLAALIGIPYSYDAPASYVRTNIEGTLAVLQTAAAAGEVVNIGSGKEITVGALASLIQSIVGASWPVVSDEIRERPSASEVERLCADASRAQALLGWTPRFTLREGLARTVEWIVEHRDRYRTSDYRV